MIEAEQENIAENAQLAEETAVEESPSLSDIAAAAEADALLVETQRCRPPPLRQQAREL